MELITIGIGIMATILVIGWMYEIYKNVKRSADYLEEIKKNKGL